MEKMATGSDGYSGNPLAYNFASNHTARDDPEDGINPMARPPSSIRNSNYVSMLWKE